MLVLPQKNIMDVDIGTKKEIYITHIVSKICEGPLYNGHNGELEILS
jgi:hypothetical protein